MKNSSVSPHLLIVSWIHEYMNKKKKTEKEGKKRASIEASRNVRSERGPETWRRATNTLAARNAEAGVFVSVVAIFTLHPWHLALFPCPRGGCPSAVGSPCRAFPTHFSFYFSQIHPVLVLPLLVGKIRRESNSRKREREIGSSISYQRTFEPISNYSFSFSFFFLETSLQIEIWIRFIRLHVVHGQLLFLSLSWRMDKGTDIIFLFSFLSIAITHTCVTFYPFGYFARCHGSGQIFGENVRPMLEFRETIHALCHSEAVWRFALPKLCLKA